MIQNNNMNRVDQKYLNAVFNEVHSVEETPARVLFSFKRREAILEATVFAAEQFLNSNNWQSQIPTVLERLGHATIVSRVYLFDHFIDENDQICGALLGEWIKPGVQSKPMDAKVPLAAAGFGRWVEVLSRGEVIFSRVDALPDDEKMNFEQDGIQSVIAVPIFVGEVFWGIIGFNDHHQARDWSAMEIDVLKIAAATLGAAIDRARSQQRLLQAQRLESVGLLAGGIAHDFNNLLTAILGQASIALHKLPEDHPAVKNLNRVKQSAERAGDLTRQLLAYAGKQQAGRERLDLVQLVKENLDFLPSTFPPDVSFKSDLPDGAYFVDGDRSQIQQIIMNLIINAGDALKEIRGEREKFISAAISTLDIGPTEHPEGMVGSEVLSNGTYVVFKVSDNGIGMSPSVLQRIFDPYFTTKQSGHGLGLSAVLGIIKAHSGGLSVQTKAGLGTTFSVYLPLLDHKAHERKAEFSDELIGCALIIDDDVMALETIRDLLKMSGMTVLTASNGLTGLQTYLANQEMIDIIILDLQMPGMDGFEVYQKLRQFSVDPKVIFVSGYGEDELNDLTRIVGDLTFVRKPFSLQDIKTAIVNLIAQTG